MKGLIDIWFSIFHRELESKPRYPTDSFRHQYNYYDGNKHSGDYLYPVTNQVEVNCAHSTIPCLYFTWKDSYKPKCKDHVIEVSGGIEVARNG